MKRVIRFASLFLHVCLTAELLRGKVTKNIDLLKRSGTMDNVLVFNFDESRVYWGKTHLDLETNRQTELQEAHPFVFVCETSFLADFVMLNFYEDRRIQMYVNINECGANPEIAVYLHVLIDPPLAFDDDDRRRINYISHLYSIPENHNIERAIYGSVFNVSAKTCQELKDNFATYGKFALTIGVERIPNHLIMITHDNPHAEADSFMTQPTQEFLKYIFSLPTKPFLP